ncbi:hypothetical protein HYPSUDRAFT_42980, partial [Hypholoma sublateritium FD-334 SS-4]
MPEVKPRRAGGAGCGLPLRYLRFVVDFARGNSTSTDVCMQCLLVASSSARRITRRGPCECAPVCSFISLNAIVLTYRRHLLQLHPADTLPGFLRANNGDERTTQQNKTKYD